MKTEKLNYQVGSKSFVSELYYDETKKGKRPGILVCPEANGLSDHIRMRCQMLVDLGYTALALDPYGEEIKDMEHMFGLYNGLMADVDELRRRGNKAIELLKAHETVDAKRVAATGYCFGGTTILEIARSGTDLAGIVGFHSGLQTPKPQDAKNIKCKVLVCLGYGDPLIPEDLRASFAKEMEDGGADWQILLFGNTVHSFTNKDAADAGMEGLAYNPSSDKRSWQAMRNFFDEVFA